MTTEFRRVLLLLLLPALLLAEEPKLPKDGLTPAQAVAKMTIPDGFQVKVFASEPELVQPFAMCFDDRGRLWVAENMHYQTRGSHLKAPEANSRICIYEDTDGDGKADKRKVFIENLFFPSGLERGFGGIWVGSPPNLLFIPDRDGDDKPDSEPEIVLDGWGIDDRHETINSFIWGPDGWLYGCHGVFTQAKVGKPGASDAERLRFNAGWWRYHPLKKKFELFAEGGSNQWAIAFDDHGQALATCCVIPHLWHVVHGGRYHRQAGQHMIPFTYDDIKTIADHKHASAHGGARVYLADNFPEPYRHRLVMGNIHEHAVLTDVLDRKGSGFIGRHGDSLLKSNDNLFIGFQIEIGPEGGVYVLDWYDTDICGRKIDPQMTGRLYRMTYGDVRTPTDLRLGTLSDEELVKLHLHVNDWYVRQARRLLHERAAAGKHAAGTHGQLRAILDGNPAVPRKLRALWSLHCTGGLTPDLAAKLLGHESEHVRAWTIQLLCEDGDPGADALAKFAELAKSDSTPLVRLYLASALQRLPLDKRWSIAEPLVSHEEDVGDHNLPMLYWYGIEPLATADKVRALKLATTSKIPVLRQFMARRLTESTSGGTSAGAAVLEKVAPGFTNGPVGEGGIVLVKDHFGRAAVQTHPVDRQTPCVLSRKLEVPVNKITKLALSVAHHEKGDWQLLVKADGKVLHDSLISAKTAKSGWQDIEVDLTPYKGRTILLQLENRANDWAWEFGYWGKAAVLTD